jgi:pyrroloquinoline quinone (PQQ) biosynthesis protein C
MKNHAVIASLAGTHAPGALRHLEQLEAQALRHEAVHHPYLQALAEGSLPDPHRGLQDFARAYEGYSAWFPRFLSAVEARLPEDLRSVLDENKDEEAGRYDEETLREFEAAGLRREWVNGIPHPELFRRFQRGIGVEPGAAVHPASPVARWREALLALLQSDHPAAAVGALGLGTELVVSRMYTTVLRAVDRFGRLHPQDRAFLVLHALVDDAHAASLLELSARFAVDAEGRAALARGMHAALGMRASFWEELHRHAMSTQEEAA